MRLNQLINSAYILVAVLAIGGLIGLISWQWLGYGLALLVLSHALILGGVYVYIKMQQKHDF